MQIPKFNQEQGSWKQSNNIKRFKRSDDELKAFLPENFYVGQAIDKGDCFFDAVAQGLKQLKPHMDFTVQSLREVCKKFAQSQLSNDQSWLKKALENEAEPINEYVPRIEFTASDIEQGPETISILGLTSPIWGRSEIEGRIICKEYGVKLHIIEKHEVEEKEVWVHQVVDESDSRSVDDINYNEANTIHIINKGNLHFEPILDETKARNVVQQESQQFIPDNSQLGSDKQSSGSLGNKVERVSNDPNQPGPSYQSPFDDHQPSSAQQSGTPRQVNHPVKQQQTQHHSQQESSLHAGQVLQASGQESSQQSSSNVQQRIRDRKVSINNRELLIASGGGDFEKVKSLIEEGVDINFADRDSDTALHYAVEGNKLQIVQLLVGEAAKTDIKNKNNETPLDIAERLKRQDIAQVLKRPASQSQQNVFSTGEVKQETKVVSSPKFSQLPESSIQAKQSVNIGEHRISHSTSRYIEKPPRFDNGDDKKRNPWRIDVPNDKNCLFLAFTLAYLIPVKDRDQSFNDRFKNLSGKEPGVNAEKFNQIKDLVKNYNPFLNMRNTYDNEALKWLTELFRNQVINHISSNKNKFKGYIVNHTKNSLEDYLFKISSSDKWGSSIEVKAISDLLNCNIYLFTTKTDYNPNGRPSIKLLYDINSAGKNKDNNHYNFYLGSDIGKEFKVYSRLEEFAKNFANQFEDKLKGYYDQVRPGGKTKTGDQKEIGVLGQILGGAVSLIFGFGLSGVICRKRGSKFYCRIFW